MSDKSDQPEPAPLSYFKTAVAFLTGLAWPALALAFFFSFKGEIRELLSAMPKKVAESTKLTVGTFSIEVERKAKAKGGAKLAESVIGLSDDAISILLETGHSSWALANLQQEEPEGKPVYYLPSKSTMRAYTELADKGLLAYSNGGNMLQDFIKSHELRPSGTTEASASTSPSIPYYPSKELGKPLHDQLSKMGFSLTEDGKAARSILVEVVKDFLRDIPAKTPDRE